MSKRKEDRIEMSQREREVLKVTSEVLAGRRTQAEAARLLELSERQIRRVMKRVRQEGDVGVVHRLRGRPSNARKRQDVREAVIQAYKREYDDFGPTFAAEKLKERQGLDVNAETLRLWLIEEGIWEGRRRRRRHRSRRPRRECAGELVQADGSDHDWLEGRGPRLTLLAMIDDATSRITARFYGAETSEGYMELLGIYIRRYGRPVALYTDRTGIYRPQGGGQAPTQMGRVLAELGIRWIAAHSPQAKGRIERSFGTLQDRLVKELRLAGVSDMEGANAVLDRLLEEHNARFAVAPADRADAHRPLGRELDLDAILSVQETRQVANDYTVRFRNTCYQLLPPAWPGLRGGKVTVERRLDGTLHIRFKTRYLKYEEIAESARAKAPEPTLAERIAKRKDALRTGPWKPAADHPWRHSRISW